MRILFNDEPMTCDDDLTVAALLDTLRQLKPGTALALNQQILPREQWEHQQVNEGDQILLFQVIAGAEMLRIADKVFDSHLFTGTGKFASPQLMVDAIRESGSQLVTLAMKRVDLRQHNDAILAPLLEAGVTLLPNTSGAKTAEEAIFAAQLAREALGTRWLKLEIHPDARWLLPDPIETLKAAEKLVQQGFTVLPYCGADPVLCKRLEEVGCAAVMPLGAPLAPTGDWRPVRCWRSSSSRRPCPWWWMRASAYPVTPRRRWRWGPMRCWSIPRLRWPTTR